VILAQRMALNTARILLAVLLLDSSAEARIAKAPEQTWSQYLQFIEKNQPEKDRILHEEMQITNSNYANSKHRKEIEDVIRKRKSGVTVLQTATLKSEEVLKLVDNGLGKSIDLIKVGSTSKVVYSNFQIKKNNSVTFTGFSVSPQSDYVILFSEENGSIDDYQLVLIDLKQDQVIPSTVLASGAGKTVRIRWISNSEFYFVGALDKLDYKIDLAVSTNPVLTNGISYSGTYPRTIECSTSGVQVVDMTSTETVRTHLENTSCEWLSLLRITGDDLDLLVHDPAHEENLKIIRYNLSDKKSNVAGAQIFQIDNQVFDSVSNFESKYFIQTHWGKTQSLLTIDMNTGQLLDQMIVPDYASIKSITSFEKNKTLSITLNTNVTTDRQLTYDYTIHAWKTEPNRDLLLTDNDGYQYVSQIFEVPSQDGTLIPFRLTYLKSTVLNENTPFLFKIYGGYDESGEFYPEFNYFIRNLFIKKGGVFIAPALRGGNEFGTSWHTQASILNRMNTFFDLIAVSNYIIEQKWTSKNKIIVTGTSAGGLVTLASGLISPDSFGLLIPISAPTDIIGKIRLDTRFYEGQKKEYGDPASPDVLNYMKKYSPLEQDINADKLPQILMVTGLNDSRVNPEHSFKMIEKFRENGLSHEKLNVLMLKNSGHWLADIGFQDLIAWRENSVIWNKIYSFLNW